MHFSFGNELFLGEFRQSGIGYHEFLEVKNTFKILQLHVQQNADTAWQEFQEPNMGDGSGQVNVPHAFPTNFLEGYFNTAFLAGDTPEFHPLVFAAKAFVIPYGTENLGTEQTIPFRLERTVIYGLRLFDLPFRPGNDPFRGGK